MRGRFAKYLTALFTLLMVIGLMQPLTAAAIGTESEDIKTALEHVSGLTVVSEDKAPEGFRFFHLTFTQPADHRNPSAGSFQQRLTLLHRDVNAPVVMYTSGYNMSEQPSRAEPTQIVDGNQVSVEYRYFTPSRPEKTNWGKQLTIWQAATDQHEITKALKSIYHANWLATGASKGGMTATYFRRFYPNDVNGTIPYVAPNDVIDSSDSYNRFLSRVGNADCRSTLIAAQRDALARRDELGKLAEKEAADSKKTFDIIGSVDKSLELSVIDSNFAFWQYQKESDCGTIPKPGAPAKDLYAFYDKVESLLSYSDQDLEGFIPYYYQAAVQLGSPEAYEEPLRDLLRYPGSDVPGTFIPKAIPVKDFDYLAMPDVDAWVKTHGNQLLFIYGENDPWSAEPFRLGAGSRDSYRYYVPGGNHGSKIAQLPPNEAAAAKATVRRWAGLPAEDPRSEQVVRDKNFPNFDRDPIMTERPPL
jgi:hypothetical protein